MYSAWVEVAMGPAKKTYPVFIFFTEVQPIKIPNIYKVGMCPSIVIDADFAYVIVEYGVLGLVLACIYYPPQSKVSRVEMTSAV